MSITSKNLGREFTHMSAASLTHQVCAEAAEKEGYPQIASLFRAMARSEAVQALSCLAAAKQVGTTRQNVETALENVQNGNHGAFEAAIEMAVKEGHPGAFLLRCRGRARARQADLFQKVLQALGAKTDLPQADLYVCPVCGHVAEGVPEGKCPNCANRPSRYEKLP